MFLNRVSIDGARTPQTDEQAAADYVRGVQRDGRLLLRFVARRPQVRLDIAAPGAAGAVPAATPDFTLLGADPARVAADPAMLAQLLRCVDELSRRAAPATVTTIRTSSAFLRINLEDGEPPEGVVRRTRGVRVMMWCVVAMAVAATLLSLLLLVHVDFGQRASQQLQAERAAIARIHGDLAKVNAAGWVLAGAAAPAAAETPAAQPLPATPPRFAPFCKGEGAHRVPSAEAAGAEASHLCGQLAEAELRQELVFRRLAGWNQRTEGIAHMVGLCFPGLSSLLPWCPQAGMAVADPLAKDWDRTEIRVAGSISVMTGFLLPLLLGCIGGSAYALRRLDQKLTDWTFQVQDAIHSCLRVLLAAMLGGLLGILWTGGAPVQLGGFTLSLAAAAFFVGFSLEVVFTVIEAMVDGVAGKLRTPDAPAPPPRPAGG